MRNMNENQASHTQGRQLRESEAVSEEPRLRPQASQPARKTAAHASHAHSRPGPRETRTPREDQAADGLPDCPVEVALGFISSRWRILIIRDLLKGACRFSELQRSVRGISQKMLTSNLRAMADCGLVTRTAYAEVPPRVEYALTELGMSLTPVFAALESWGEEYKERVASQACGATEGK